MCRSALQDPTNQDKTVTTSPSSPSSSSSSFSGPIDKAETVRPSALCRVEERAWSKRLLFWVWWNSQPPSGDVHTSITLMRGRASRRVEDGISERRRRVRG
jgi:hypothetical protein